MFAWKVSRSRPTDRVADGIAERGAVSRRVQEVQISEAVERFDRDVDAVRRGCLREGLPTLHRAPPLIVRAPASRQIADRRVHRPRQQRRASLRGLLDAGAHVRLRPCPPIRLGCAEAQSRWNDGDGRAREFDTSQRLPDSARRKADRIEHRDLDPVEPTFLIAGNRKKSAGPNEAPHRYVLIPNFMVTAIIPAHPFGDALIVSCRIRAFVRGGSFSLSSRGDHARATSTVLAYLPPGLTRCGARLRAGSIRPRPRSGIHVGRGAGTPGGDHRCAPTAVALSRRVRLAWPHASGDGEGRNGANDPRDLRRHSRRAEAARRQTLVLRSGERRHDLQSRVADAVDGRMHAAAGGHSDTA